MKNNPSVILVRPQLPENIGMTARAMDNCGFNELILVSPREEWPNDISLRAAGNSKNILKKVKVYESLDKALFSFNYVIATSSRKRFLLKPSIRNFNNLFKKFKFYNKIAFVFGPENSGLSNRDLMLCDLILNIQLSKTNKSLNLSHAVLIVCYKWTEYFRITSKNTKSNKILDDVASKKDFLYFMNFLKKELDEVGFLYPKTKNIKMFHNIQTMFLRSQLTKTEIKILWGMIKKLKKPKKIIR